MAHSLLTQPRGVGRHWTFILHMPCNTLSADGLDEFPGLPGAAAELLETAPGLELGACLFARPRSLAWARLAILWDSGYPCSCTGSSRACCLLSRVKLLALASSSLTPQIRSDVLYPPSQLHGSPCGAAARGRPSCPQSRLGTATPS